MYLIPGGYAAIAVDFKDHIAILEGGQSEARGLAVIAEAKRLIPNKPIRTSSTRTATSIIRAACGRFVAEGATIRHAPVNKAYLEKVFSAPHTLNPDRLARSPRKPTFETMTDKKVMTDGNQTLELHHLRGSGHNEGIIVAYLPKQRILIEADAYNPPADPAAPMPTPPSPYTRQPAREHRAAPPRARAHHRGSLPGRRTGRDEGGADEGRRPERIDLAVA